MRIVHFIHIFEGIRASIYCHLAQTTDIQFNIHIMRSILPMTTRGLIGLHRYSVFSWKLG